VVSTTPCDLVGALVAADESDYVRLVADWMAHGPDDLEAEPAPSGRAVVDVLVAAAVAHVGLQRDDHVPEWTCGRVLTSWWHPGAHQFLAWSFVHAPVAFKSRGVLIEADSLVSV